MKRVLLVIAAILMMGNAFSQDKKRWLPSTVRQQIQDIEAQARQRPVPMTLNTDKIKVIPKAPEVKDFLNIWAKNHQLNIWAKNHQFIRPIAIDSAIVKKYHLKFSLNTSLKQSNFHSQEKYGKLFSSKFHFDYFNHIDDSIK